MTQILSLLLTSLSEEQKYWIYTAADRMELC